MRVTPPNRVRPWHEPVRITLTVLWVTLLTLWLYHQVLYLYGASQWSMDAATAASIVLRTGSPLWFACFFPALATGLGWYVFSHRLRTVSTSILDLKRDRLSALHAHFSFCTGCFTYLLAYRVLPILPMCTDGFERASPTLAQFYWGDRDFSLHVDVVLDRWIWVAGLAAALVILQAWGSLPRLGGSRRHLLLLVSLLLMMGVAVPVVRIHESIPLPISADLFDLDETDAATHALLVERPQESILARNTLATFLATHDDEGYVIRFRDLRWNLAPGHPFPLRDDRCEAICQLCLLPAVPVFTLQGIPVRLAAVPKHSSEPGVVIELSRLGLQARVYEPTDPRHATSVPLSDLAHTAFGTDWVVVKADVALRMTVIRGLLESLQQAGIKQANLAVVSFGFLRAPTESPHLLFGEANDLVRFELPPRPPTGDTNIIVVKKYVPPRNGEPRPCCDDVEDWEYHDFWYELAPPEEDSVSSEIRIDIGERMFFGRFAAIVSSAWYGGARTIYLPPGSIEPSPVQPDR